MKIRFLSPQFVSTVILLSVGITSRAQKKNAYRFIEPNISISYDSTRFKMGDTYSNHVYGTEAVDFRWRNDTTYRITTNVKAQHAKVALSKSFIDSVVIEKISNLKTDKEMPIVSIDEKPVDVHGFSFYGMVMQEPTSKEYMTLLIGWRGFEGGYTEVKHTSFNRNNLAKEYPIVRDLLAGYQWYPPSRINEEDSLIKKQYTVRVDSTAVDADEKRYERIPYTVIVTTEQPLQHQLLAVEVIVSPIMREVFDCKDGKSVRIKCSDRETGVVTKKADLVIANSFGKKVRIPFTFSYNNNGK